MVSATTRTARAVPSQATDEPRCGPGIRRARRTAARSAGSPMPCWSSRRARPISTSWPPTAAAHAEPLEVGEVLHRGQRRRSARGPRWVMAAAMGCSEASSSAPAIASASAVGDAGGGVHGDQAHLAGGDGAGLVQHDGVDAAGGLQHFGPLDQDAELGAAAGADH